MLPLSLVSLPMPLQVLAQDTEGVGMWSVCVGDCKEEADAWDDVNLHKVSCPDSIPCSSCPQLYIEMAKMVGDKLFFGQNHAYY